MCSEGGTVISTEVLGPDQLKSVLSIEVVDTTHDGVYVCVVSTGYNKLTADLLLLLEKGEWHTNGYIRMQRWKCVKSIFPVLYLSYFHPQH